MVVRNYGSDGCNYSIILFISVIDENINKFIVKILRLPALGNQLRGLFLSKSPQNDTILQENDTNEVDFNIWIAELCIRIEIYKVLTN
jgi:hypothetical protein